jgi:cation diffusion facilitator CzcD-associated flavoprotein CzcO
VTGPAIVIVGSGFSGLGMAIQLKKAGRHDFVILEKAEDLGGTWRENSYPGCACDVPSHLYSYSFEPKADWSRRFADRSEIWEYLRHCAAKYGIGPHIRFGTDVTGAEYDETTGTWRVFTAGGDAITCEIVVFAVGPLHTPAYPQIRGIEEFRGKVAHSAAWDHDYDLAGKRVAVVGTGASAIQLVPKIAPQVAALHLFQRTPPWILPRLDRAVSARTQRLFRRMPLLQCLYRASIYWRLESRAVGFLHPRIAKPVEALARRHLRRQVADPQLRRALTPNYRIGCKRVLLSDDYYPTLTRSDVEVVTAGIAEIRPNSIVTDDGIEREIDGLILATGFDVAAVLDRLHIVGSGGRKLADAWRDGIEAYLGLAVSGFPNLFFLLGPNTGLGHNSVVFMLEAQVRHLLGCLRLLDDRPAGQVTVRPAAQAEFNRRLQERLSTTVWNAGGCRSWYLDVNGVNRVIWPGSTVRFWLETRRIRKADYEFTASDGP